MEAEFEGSLKNLLE